MTRKGRHRTLHAIGGKNMTTPQLEELMREAKRSHLCEEGGKAFVGDKNLRMQPYCTKQRAYGEVTCAYLGVTFRDSSGNRCYTCQNMESTPAKYYIHGGDLY